MSTTPTALPRSACNHCGGAIVWTRSATDTPLPIDAEPSPVGNLLLAQRADGHLTAGVASPGVARSARVMGRPTYAHHATTCPFASAWNKPGTRGRSGGRPPARAAARRR